MTTKTPFEIRLEVLKMARDLALENMCFQRDRCTNLWEAQDRKGHLDWPDFPTNEQILEKANELYSFVTTKS